MLITPMTPKVMARPMAASSRTEPSESPYHTFWTLFHIVRLVWIAPIASCAVRLTPSGVPAGRLDSNASASWSPRWRITPIASTFSVSLASGLNRMTAACASTSARRTFGLVSFLIAATRVSSAFGSLDLNTARAASRRRAGSGDIRVRPPIAASMARRTRLLTRTGERSPGTEAAGLPVAASRTAPARSRMKTRFSCALNSSRPSCNASTKGIASGLPLWAIAATAVSVSAKLSVRNPDNALSRFCACAALAPTSATHSMTANDSKRWRNRQRIENPPA